MAGGLFGDIFKVVNQAKAASAANYDLSKDPMAGIKQLYQQYASSNAGGYDPAELQNDPLYQLDLQKAAAQYGGGGGGYSYSGPSIAAIQQMGQQGQARISDLYGQLDQYLKTQQADVANRYAQANTTAQQQYDAAKADIEAARATGNQALASTTGQGAVTNAAQAPTAEGAAKTAVADAAVRDMQNLVNQQIQRQENTLASNRANALSSIGTLGAGQASIMGDWIAGSAKEKTAQSQKLSDQVSNMVQAAQAQIEQARAKAAAAAADQANKLQVAKINALESAMKRQQSSGKSSDNLSGVRGVLEFAMRNNRPDLARKFVDLVNSSKIRAEQQNAAAANDPSGLTKRTSASDELWKSIEAAGTPSGGARIDLGGNIDENALMQQIQNMPELSFLKPYIISDYNQAARRGLLPTGQAKDTRDLPTKVFDYLSGYQPPGGEWWQKATPIPREQFSPVLDIRSLLGNQGDVKKYYQAFEGAANNADFLSQLFNIYTGKYGKGG